MSRTEQSTSRHQPPHGAMGYLQIPAVDIARSADFYRAVFGWSVDLTYASFEAPGMIGQWVSDRRADSRWYRELLGLESDHGGPHYERLLANGNLVLQLHNRETEHDHGPTANPAVEVGNGVMLWFGDVSDFDDVIERVRQLDATIVLPPHRNPAGEDTNGPSHREIWIKDPDGYTVVIASPDGEAHHPT